MSQNLRIEDLLGELSQEGQLDSRGSFTLDAKAAVQKLSKFQLEDPSAYLVKIVQAALASGATRCDMTVGVFNIECWLPGASFDVSALGSVPGELLKPATATPERYHLAVALNGAISTVIASIELAGFDGKHGQKVVWKSGETQTTEWTPPKERSQGDGALLYLKFSRNSKSRSQAIYDVFGTRDVIGMLSGGETGWTRDEKVLHAKFDLAAIPIRLNGREVRWGFKSFDTDPSLWSVFTGLLSQESFSQELYFPGRSSFKVRVQSHKPQIVDFKASHLEGDDVTPNLKVKQMISERPGRPPVKTAIGTPVTCQLWAGAFHRQNDRLLSKAPGTRLILVDDGFLIFDQTFARTSTFGGSGSGVVIASAKGLSKDLSSLQLIDNEALHKRIRAASQILSLLVDNRLDHAAEAGWNFLLELQRSTSYV